MNGRSESVEVEVRYRIKTNNPRGNMLLELYGA